ncbi:hypothetical protein [Azospirillum sp. B4]|uniref:hypothetical protein n=1 Tax=Azospirillum sp. B4 TaxID=95605 RepID=UPI00034D6DEC
MTLLQQSPLPGAVSAAPVLAPRALGAINWVGFATLTKREIRRFLKVWVQTIAAPVVTTLLFYAVSRLFRAGPAPLFPLHRKVLRSSPPSRRRFAAFAGGGDG